MRGHEKVRDVCEVNFSCDSSVVAGRARVLEHSAAIGCDPDEAKDSGVNSGSHGSEVVEREVGLGDGQDGGQVKRRRRGVADGNDCFWDVGRLLR